MATKYWISTSSTDFTAAANWSTTSAPANNDVLIFDGRGTASALSNLASVLTGVTLYVYKTYGGSVGVLPSGATAAAYLQFDGGTIYLQQNNGISSATGTPLLMLKNSGATAMTINVYDSASSSGAYPPVIITGGTAITINQMGGSIAVSPFNGDTATVAAHNVANGGNAISPAYLYGPGVTSTALTSAAGSGLSMANNTHAALVLSGNGTTLTTTGTGAVTALTVGNGSTCKYFGSGTLTAGSISGTFDRTGDTRALTITNMTVYRGASILLNNGKAGSITKTNPIVLSQCGMHELAAVSTPIGETL